ncbi:putative zinc finger protein 840 [Malaya genurostris]|uniref:putative zinc finger protein 840 n=1 Tax=Malaya genurostris TaxID=325434 RepID=UPI0026F3F111|nr:putative zinc finger protein 840 [Malaya genurostris]
MEKICRLCLQNGPNLKPVEDHSSYTQQDQVPSENILQLIFRYLSIQIVKHEPPDDMAVCSSCRSAILEWHRFRECCIRNDEIYQKLALQVITQNLTQTVDLPTDYDIERPKQEYAENDVEQMDNTDDPHFSEECLYDMQYEDSTSATIIDLPDHSETESICEDKLSVLSKIPLKKRGRPKNTKHGNQEAACERDNSDFSTSSKKRGRPKLTVKTERRVEVCTICGKFIKNISEHMRIHNNEKRHQCPFCPKAFVSASNYNSHVNIHTRAKMYKCDLCEKQYPMLNGLKQHRKTHFKERVYLCPVCGKAYYQPTGLARHKRTHFEEPKIKCSECDKLFLTNADLRKHFTKHLDEKPFACDICGRAFRRKDNLVTHTKTHRAMIQPAASKNSPPQVPLAAE